ncbi:SGNH/GDSL hydrolase family protein [Fibrobacterales bacterium]|nr:SGNH/GDSL hydrolase family protein [Fibrobacterales bacterium]
MKIFFISLALLVSLIHSMVKIPLNDTRIKFEGVYYPQISDSIVILNRHLDTMKNFSESGISGGWIQQWVKTQTGVRVRIKTSSPRVKFEFSQREGGGVIGAVPSSGFTIFSADSVIAKFSSLDFILEHPNPEVSQVFELSLPNLWAVNFTGLSLDKGYSLEALPELNNPVYVAIGNSITHGTGQYVSSAKTYPYLLAQKKDWNLYNLAVAGAGMGWGIALNTKNQKVDVISVLIGFNDWKYKAFPIEHYQTIYSRLLDSLRSFHPMAQIYAISPLVTKETEYAAPFTIQEMRNMMSSVVKEKQRKDSSLCMINGPEISNISMLSDLVHLNENGARQLSENLTDEMNECKQAIVPLIQNEILGHFKNLGQGVFEFRPISLGKYRFKFFNLKGVLVYEKNLVFEDLVAQKISINPSEANLNFNVIQIIKNEVVINIKTHL